MVFGVFTACKTENNGCWCARKHESFFICFLCIKELPALSMDTFVWGRVSSWSALQVSVWSSKSFFRFLIQMEKGYCCVLTIIQPCMVSGMIDAIVFLADCQQRMAGQWLGRVQNNVLFISFCIVSELTARFSKWELDYRIVSTWLQGFLK